MLWLFLGLAAALGDAGSDALTKRFFSHLSPYTMGLVRLIYAAPFLILTLLFLMRPSLDRTFWQVVAVMLPLEVIATLLYMKALKVSHLSLSIPFLAFTPVLMIFTGWVLLGEALNCWGILGTLLIAGGSYILSLGMAHQGFWAPLKALARESGPRLMLTVAVIYSCTASLFKVAILHSQATFFGASYLLALTVVMLAGYPLTTAKLRPAFKSHVGWGVALGFAIAVSVLSLAHGLTRAPATYLIAVKRLSLLISVVLGGLWLKERPFLPRLAGAALMCAGVILIALRGG